MYEKQLKEMEAISKHVGMDPAITQGGGGNTSVKLDENLMAVKASGCKLKDMTTTEGFVVIDYKKLRAYLDDIDLNVEKDYYKESTQFVKDNTVHLEGLQEGMRASVEAGFHSLLLDYVIHTHSVYANLLSCAGEGKRITEVFFGNSKYGYMWVPYIAPGFELTMGIKKKLDVYKNSKGVIPKILFMENHGLIVTGDTYEECVEINDYVNNTIMEKLNLNAEYGYVGIEETAKDEFVSQSDILKGYFAGTTSYMNAEWFASHILYPDQAVYLLGSISNDSDNKNKININLETGSITYNTNHKEALTMEETIVAFIYILEKAKDSDLTVMTMKKEDIDFIINWEGVKYRKNLLKK